MNNGATRERRASILFRILSTYAVLSILAGCSGWQRQDLLTDHSMGTDLPREMRVELRDGTAIVLLDAVLVGETLEGWEKIHEFPGRSDAKVSIPLSDIKSSSAPQSAGKGVVLYVVGLLVLGVVAIAIAMAVTGEGPGVDGNCCSVK